MITSILRIFVDAEDSRLRNEILRLSQQVRELSWDEPFGMLTRNAFLQRCRELPPSDRSIAFIDLNDIGELNHIYGYSEVDRRIAASFAIFRRSAHTVARWYSGDEIAILFAGHADPPAQIERLRLEAQSNGLCFASAWGGWACGCEPVETAIQRLSKQVGTLS